MSTLVRENHYRDKSAFADGPWQSEPDYVHFIDEATDLDCLLNRNHLGAWCGYVGVVEGHPAFGGDASVEDVEVHGGVTFGGFCDDAAPEGQGVCHVPLPGRPDHVFWIGFDCAHGWDLVPGMDALTRELGFRRVDPHMVYRDRAYVEAECRSLARQLVAMQ